MALRILTVCPTSQGSSLILKMWLGEVLQEAGLEADVDVSDPRSAETTDCDLIVSTTLFAQSLDTTVPVIGIVNVTDKEEYRQKVLPVIRKLMG